MSTLQRPFPGQVTEHDTVRMLDHLVQRAVAVGASDVHLEPKRKGLRVRFRIDGVMSEQGILPSELAPSLATRIKVLGRMDMTIRMLPQDGQFSLELSDGRLVHLRASTFPAIHGENLVLRVLMGHQLIALGKLGMDEDELDTVRRLATVTAGLVIVCGPTGSGKTSTLYSLLQEVDTENLSVVTLEDPIEVEFERVTQGQTNVRQGFTFAAGLRSILRQDPDVILVGEMRDAETAQIALQASLTGHLVLSTLHTSNTVETVARLVDLGAEPWIVGNALQAIIAQRLVRVLCSQCSEAYEQPNDLTASYEDERVVVPRGTMIKRSRGCERCHGTGYVGRTGLFEVLEIDDELRDLIKARATMRSYKDYVREHSLRRLREVGLLRVKAGITSLEEVLRVT
ncbi:MAG: type II/IV secretion system protein [Deltaproteobacteria bacterium]|nr:type II/IV secretion system protein [Deltaproteobacteria bacterium]